MKKRKKIIACIAFVLVICIIGGVGLLYLKYGRSNLSKEQKAILKTIEATYDVENQEEIAQQLEEEKDADTYTLDNMLVEYNPFGTNTQSLYVYFNTDEPASVSYTISVDDDSIGDFSQTSIQAVEYLTEHESQLSGLVPDMENTITFTVTYEDGSTETAETTYEMGSILGNEEVQLETNIEGDVE